MERIQPKNNRGALWVGVIFFILGFGWLMREMDARLPHWLFGWEMILIVIGLAVGARNNFRDAGWFVMVIIGVIFLLRDIFPFLTIYNYIWPIALIVLGIFLISRPLRKSSAKQNQIENSDATGTQYGGNEDYLNYTTAFGGLKKNILTKNFRGGEVTCIFGGTELNFMQADFQGSINLEVTQIFGGTKIIIPAHWEVRSEMTAVFGGIDDKRVPSAIVDHNKVLVLEGTSIFGGIEIVSY